MVASGVAQRFDLFILTCLRTVFDAPHSVESLWVSDQPVAETSTWQHTTLTIDKQTNIHAPGVIRTHNLSRRAAEDLRLRPRGHWDRRLRLWTLCEYSQNTQRNNYVAYASIQICNSVPFVSCPRVRTVLQPRVSTHAVEGYDRACIFT